MLYHKIIDGQEVFNNGTSLRVNGRWVSNPTPAMYEQEGWSVYTPPPFVPQPQTEPDYYDVMQAVKKMFSTETSELTDEEALEVAALYPTWASKIGQAVTAGERLWYDTKLYKVIQAHTVQEEWTPDITPALYVEVSIEEWPEFVQPTGAQDAYNTGDKVTFEGQHYICQMDGCTWSPSAYHAAWQLVE